ncbi:unnamed protein product [Bursaphelenchus xylophilus]|uniref:(pine wood nematode) hypothetical protein n=1 Tax=Bursaphelenchus xylophilus TaxID=6326 RepID=A0A1I7S3Z6_BURXY|nr:unnamed protein product [Bursaphelenchus xylophilus]CAG9116585.1 unnamed protein product [Bursaphelenchus xylophilus]
MVQVAESDVLVAQPGAFHSFPSEIVDEHISTASPTSSTSPSILIHETSSTRSSTSRELPVLSPGSPCTSSACSTTSNALLPSSPESSQIHNLKPPTNNSSGMSPTSSSSESTLDEHSATLVSSRKQSVIEKRHICDICGKGFPYLSILESHKRCHTGEKPFKCHFCDKRFAQKATLQVHERTHTGERPYKCKYCEKTFAQYGTKTVHEKSAHLGIRNYKCPKCDKCLSSPSALYTHKKTHGDKVFQCPCCPKTFTLKNYLKLHVKQVHEQTERKHVCKFCQKSFAYAGSLQVHIRTHTGERPYCCKYCPKAFASQGNLQSHERTHTGERPYSCAQCNRTFIQKSQLTAHEATHNISSSSSRKESTDSIDGMCKLCGKNYSYPSVLCKLCEKTFNIVQPQAGSFQCEACGLSFVQKISLKVHQEKCQNLLNRRGSVVTNDSESSPSRLDDPQDLLDLDSERKRSLDINHGLLSGPLRPEPVHLNKPEYPAQSLLDPLMNPGLLSQLTSPTMTTPTFGLPPQSNYLLNQNLYDASSSSTLQFLQNLKSAELLSLLQQPQQQPLLPPPTSSFLPNQELQQGGHEMLVNNNYKSTLDNLLAEQQLLRLLMEVQQQNQPQTATVSQNLLSPPASLAYPSQSDLNEQLLLKVLEQQRAQPMERSEQQLAGLLPTSQHSDTANILTALNDLARQSQPVQSSHQLSI